MIRDFGGRLDLDTADRNGILVRSAFQVPTPTDGLKSREDFEIFKKSWEDVVIRQRNHPSLVIWELFNESWGIHKGLYGQFPAAKQIIAELHEAIKALDPTRLVLDIAGGRILNELAFAGNHRRTDLHELHHYEGFPKFAEWRTMATSLKAYGKPLLIGEYGPAPYRHGGRGTEPRFRASVAARNRAGHAGACPASQLSLGDHCRGPGGGGGRSVAV
ncbi:MAG: glycoside hydrolase family 2 TIM barrel-domain containing protein [Longimicrobiales bacterium]